MCWENLEKSYIVKSMKSKWHCSSHLWMKKLTSFLTQRIGRYIWWSMTLMRRLFSVLEDRLMNRPNYQATQFLSPANKWKSAKEWVNNKKTSFRDERRIISLYLRLNTLETANFRKYSHQQNISSIPIIKRNSKPSILSPTFFW